MNLENTVPDTVASKNLLSYFNTLEENKNSGGNRKQADLTGSKSNKGEKRKDQIPSLKASVDNFLSKRPPQQEIDKIQYAFDSDEDHIDGKNHHTELLLNKTEEIVTRKNTLNSLYITQETKNYNFAASEKNEIVGQLRMSLYFKEYFDFSLFDFIFPNLGTREVAVVCVSKTGKTFYRRNLRFVHGIDMKQLWDNDETYPIAFHIGAYYTPIDKEDWTNQLFASLQKKKVEKLGYKSEIKIEFDMNSAFRNCSCKSNPRICPDCLPILQATHSFYTSMLQLKYGCQDIISFYTGRRGIVIIARDMLDITATPLLDEDRQRLNILQELSVDENLQIPFLSHYSFTSNSRLINEVLTDEMFASVVIESHRFLNGMGDADGFYQIKSDISTGLSVIHKKISALLLQMDPSVSMKEGSYRQLLEVIRKIDEYITRDHEGDHSDTRSSTDRCKGLRTLFDTLDNICWSVMELKTFYWSRIKKAVLTCRPDAPVTLQVDHLCKFGLHPTTGYFTRLFNNNLTYDDLTLLNMCFIEPINNPSKEAIEARRLLMNHLSEEIKEHIAGR